jgi:hypothetical protein
MSGEVGPSKPAFHKPSTVVTDDHLFARREKYRCVCGGGGGREEEGVAKGKGEKSVVSSGIPPTSI